MTTRRPQPLLYGPSSCVAPYLDPNIRFQLSLLCPGYLTVHNTQTLKIHDLHMRPKDFKINGTSYSVGIIREYPATRTPQSFIQSNANGGVQHDVDRYGIAVGEDLAGENQEMDPAAELARLEERLKFMVRNLGKNWAVEMKYDSKIEELQLEILAYRMRMANQEPPFTHYLQLTTTTGGVQKVERVEYTQNLKIAKNYILGKIFDVADRKVQVKILRIGNENLRLVRLISPEI